MSQEVSTNQKASDSSNTEQISVQPWSAETYAEKWMDDLFSDIDRVLENGSKLPTEPVQREYVSLDAIKVPQISMPSAVIPFQKRETPQEDKNIGHETIKKPEPQITARPPANNYLVEKLLLAAACLSGLGTLILWLVVNKQLDLPFLPQSPTSVAIVQKPEVIEADPQFVNYMMRSLEVIDRKAQASKKQQATSTLPNQAPANPANYPNNVNQTLRQSNPVPNVLERVYIPYQAPQIAPPQVQTVPTPTRPNSSTSPRPAASVPNLPTIPKVTVRSQPPVANMPPLLLTPPPPPSTFPTETPNTATAPVAKYTLVGLLELGDRSAALFEINGVTQRIHAGESIGTSGWTLVAVANQEALIRRNGEIRSIYVGQKF